MNSLLFLLTLAFTARQVLAGCKIMIFDTRRDGKYLASHVIANHTAEAASNCRYHCYGSDRCQSVNYNSVTRQCELSDSDEHQAPRDLIDRESFIYLGTNNACSSSPCSPNGKCIADFENNGFKCSCNKNFSGKSCKTEWTPTSQQTIDPSTPLPTDPSTPLPTDPSTPLQTDPSTPLRTDPSTTISTDPSTPLPTDPSTPLQTDPSTPLPTDPSTPLPTDPSTPPPTDPSTTLPNDPSTTLPTDQSTPLPTDPSTPLPTDPSTPFPADPSTPLQTDPSTPLPTDPSTPLPTDPSTPLSTDPSTPLLSDPSTPLPTDPSTPLRTVKPCDSSPCKNNGTCVDVDVKGYRCACAQGFTGLDCDIISVDPCKSEPCQNNGTCAALSASDYNCKCPAGFGGTECNSTCFISFPATRNPGNVVVVSTEGGEFNEFAISFWLRLQPPQIGDLEYTVFSYVKDGAVLMFLKLKPFTTQAVVKVGYYEKTISSNINFWDNNWHKFCMTSFRSFMLGFFGININLYVDGALQHAYNYYYYFQKIGVQGALYLGQLYTVSGMTSSFVGDIMSFNMTTGFDVASINGKDCSEIIIQNSWVSWQSILENGAVLKKCERLSV
ncbi:putative GPI-anchored protein pfl2 isoform X9 [Nematostella vectensis]|uniref:putative GPI-anchored protein pfl2 isoform X9 n=1 Tax=Nematostella vectensis TaxID=45351 RepID=UPI0020779A5C|nr:putative GPI-anchored protein pfl2 isoform X9 [Nematostella vectensis]